MWWSVLRTLAFALAALVLGFVLPASWSLACWALLVQDAEGGVLQPGLWLGLSVLAALLFAGLRVPALREPVRGQCLALLTVFLVLLLALASALPLISLPLVSRAQDLLLVPCCVLPAALLRLALDGGRAGLEGLALFLLPVLPYFAVLALCAGLAGLAPPGVAVAAAVLLAVLALAFARPAAVARAYAAAAWLPTVFLALDWLLFAAAAARLAVGLVQGRDWSSLRELACAGAGALAASAFSALLSRRLEPRPAAAPAAPPG